MPLVNVWGRVADFSQKTFDPALEPRLWFVPNHARFAVRTAFHSEEVLADWTNDWNFSVDLWSEPEDPDMYYTLQLDHLVPGQQTEPPKRRARAVVEWPYKIYPGEGGSIGNLVQQVYGSGLVLLAGNAPVQNRVNQLHLNTETWDLYERVVTW